MAKVYTVPCDDADTGFQHFRLLSEARELAQSEADRFGHDIEITCDYVNKLPLATLVVCLLNHEGWCDPTRGGTFIVRPRRKVA